MTVQVLDGKVCQCVAAVNRQPTDDAIRVVCTSCGAVWLISAS